MSKCKHNKSRIKPGKLFDPSKYIGRKYNHLTVIDYDHFELRDGPDGKYWEHYVVCRRDCGAMVVIPLSDVIAGSVKNYGDLCTRFDIGDTISIVPIAYS